MLKTDSSLVIIKEGDLIKITYNGGHDTIMKYTKNVITDQEVSLLKMDKGVDTTLLCDESTRYNFSMFNTIGGIDITSNMILFNKLEEML
jgi:hypothetical protein